MRQALKPLLYDEDGPEAARPAILILTVYEDEEKNSIRSHPDEIVRALQEMLAGGAPMTPPIARKVVDSLSRASRTRHSPEESLSRRETEVLQSLTKGSSNKEIAEELNITVDTIRWHLKQIYHKFHVHGRTEAAIKYLKLQQERK